MSLVQCNKEVVAHICQAGIDWINNDRKEREEAFITKKMGERVIFFLKHTYTREEAELELLTPVRFFTTKDRINMRHSEDRQKFRRLLKAIELSNGSNGKHIDLDTEDAALIQHWREKTQ